MKKNTDFPYFKKSKDREFVKACQEILDNPLYMTQWVEEADREDPILLLKKGYKAFNCYTLPDGRIASLWNMRLPLSARMADILGQSLCFVQKVFRPIATRKLGAAFK